MLSSKQLHIISYPIYSHINPQTNYIMRGKESIREPSAEFAPVSLLSSLWRLYMLSYCYFLNFKMILGQNSNSKAMKFKKKHMKLSNLMLIKSWLKLLISCKLMSMERRREHISICMWNIPLYIRTVQEMTKWFPQDMSWDHAKNQNFQHNYSKRPTQNIHASMTRPTNYLW